MTTDDIHIHFRTWFDLFTTLRRSTPEKSRYYKSLIGEIMAVDVAQSSVSV